MKTNIKNEIRNDLKKEIKCNMATKQKPTFDQNHNFSKNCMVLVPLKHNMHKDNDDLCEQKINRQTNLNNDRIVSMGITGCVTKTKALNPTVQKVKIVVSVRSEKKSELELSNSSRKLSSPGKDLILLILIMLIPTIPFWQL